MKGQSMIPQLVDDILDTFPDGAPYSELLEALGFILASLIAHASLGSPSFQELLLQTVIRDLQTKVQGRVM